MLLSSPRLIFLDAMGTMFTLRRSVGEIYADRARLYGIEVDAVLLERAFHQVFKRYHAPAFAPIPSGSTLAQLEKAWWSQVVAETFQLALNQDSIPHFEVFFNDVFAYFASGTPWILFPEVRAVLQKWSEANIELGVISNFDSRLIGVLQALEIAAYFQSITISSQVGVAKPDPKIFQHALEKHRCDPDKAVHVGDQWKDDLKGACSAQIQGVLIDRSPHRQHPDSISALDEIVWDGE